MNNNTSKFKFTIIYISSLIIAVSGILLILYLGYKTLNSMLPLISGEAPQFSLLNKEVSKDVYCLVNVGLIGITLLIERWLFIVRIKCRRIIDYDKDGNSKKYSDYEKLSRKEKDEIDKQKLHDDERLINFTTLRRITHQGSKTPEKDMDKLIGMYKVKSEMKEMAARMEYEQKFLKKDKHRERPSMHMCFTGAPGTGKTTVARIMAGFLYKYGYITENKCIEVDGNFFKGNGPGETSEKTKLLLRKAKHGVLFIDEAYSLLSNTGFSHDQEAIATIVKEMEDSRSDLVIIFAGYEAEMRSLISSNPGIFSRIKHYLKFEDYSIEELSKIFTSMANEKNFYVSAGAVEKFQDRMYIEKKDKYFGNARTVRNYLERAVDKHAANVIQGKLSKSDIYQITKDDIPTDSFKL